jgi:tRNA 2-thiocytidine biosynthesis protein TtcA
MQQLMSYMRSAMEHYNMISDGDKLAVGVSGGKDSVAMLAALARMRGFYPAKFDLTAIIMDPRFNGEDTDYSELEALCVKINVPCVIRRTQIGSVIFETRNEKNPCSLCARMRRGILHDEAKAADCNKLALGHHMDDAAETFMMNLLNGGTIGSFSPVTYLSRKDITVIRPMIFARESDAARVSKRESLPIVKSQCPVDGATERQEVKLLINSLERKYGNVRSKIIGALQNGGISGY